MNDSTLTDTRRHSFFIIDNDVIDTHGEKLGPYGIAVYCLLVRHASRAGTCFPSYSTIANKINISRPKAIEMVKLLIELKLVGKVSRENDKGEATSNEYSILQVVNTVNHPSKPDLPPVVNDVYPKNTNTKQDTSKKKEQTSCAATQTPASFPSKKKEKEKKPEHPNTKAIFDAYCAVVSEAEPGCKILYPATRVCAQELAAAGWEPEQVTKAFWLMKKDAFWKAKHLTLMSVQKQIAALLKGKSNASDSEQRWIQEIELPDIDLDTLSFNF